MVLIPIIVLGAFILFFILIVIWMISIYNRLVRLRNLLREGFSGIDVQLKKRADLIPNLVEIVKGYAAHESSVFERVTEMRNMARNASTVAEKAEAEAGVGRALSGLFAIAENYPELRANENFMQLHKTLEAVEEELEMARRYYNGTVRNYNISVESFPANLIATRFGFFLEDYFEVRDESDRDVPMVSTAPAS